MANDPGDREDEDLVRLYLSEIGRHPLLSKDDEVRLAQRIEDGARAAARLGDPATSPTERAALRRLVRWGADAERLFIVSNLRLVVSIAKRYQASGLPLLDLVQEGNLGLMHAVEKFDWRKGFKFSTYATWWIRQAITRGIANTGRTIRLPVHAGDLVTQLRNARVQIENQLGRPADVAELSAELELTVEKVSEALRFSSEPISLSEPVSDEGEAELGDLIEDVSAIAPFDAVAAALLPDQITRMLAHLEPREREVLRMRYGLDRGEPRTLEEVGAQFRLTRERIRQIEARAISKLRHPSLEVDARSLLVV